MTLDRPPLMAAAPPIVVPKVSGHIQLSQAVRSSNSVVDAITTSPPMPKTVSIHANPGSQYER